MTPTQRSLLMGRIQGRHTTPELLLRKSLWNRGIRYRLHRRLEGSRPDLVISATRIAVFVDGCFWHCCPIHGVRPKTNVAFWRTKLDGNRARDRRNNTALRAAGWTVIRFWEHEIEKSVDRCAERVLRAHRIRQGATV